MDLKSEELRIQRNYLNVNIYISWYMYLAVSWSLFSSKCLECAPPCPISSGARLLTGSETIPSANSINRTIDSMRSIVSTRVNVDLPEIDFGLPPLAIFFIPTQLCFYAFNSWATAIMS